MAAEQALGKHPGQRNGGDQDAGHARFDVTEQLLQRKGDAGQRCVEGRRDACRAARHEQMMALDAQCRRQKAPGCRHQARADLYGWPFAAKGKSRAHRGDADKNLAEGDA